MAGGYIPVSPNETIVFGGWAYLQSGSATHENWNLVARDASYNPVAYATSSPGIPSSGWVYQVGTYTVGSGVAYVQLYNEISGATTATVARFDDGFITAGTQYYHQDHLSNRLITDVNGNKIGEQGHFSFGESLPSSGTTTNWQFTTYERDAESGNDYANQRYYPNRLGRFMMPDPLSGDIGDPQSLNGYAYVRNSPLSLTDPTGMQTDGGGCEFGCGGPGCDPFFGCAPLPA
jgi:RHS repeat-associated protein